MWRENRYAGWNKLALALSVLILVSVACPSLRVAGASDVENIEDREVTMAIEDELFVDTMVPGSLIDVETTNGVVTLTGTVDNLLAKQRAVRIVESTRGVRSVVDRIMVKTVSREDREIASDVAEALLRDPATEAFEIDVKVKDGVVTLGGTVDSWAEKNLAATVAMGVRGVGEVKNEIGVRFAEIRPDPEIEREIRRRLSLDPYLDEGLIDVTVTDGNVTLRGSVRSAIEKTAVYEDALVDGVKSIDDSALLVKWWLRDETKRRDKYAQKSDEDIESAIKDALAYDPRTLSFTIDVDVNQGVARLSGIVDNLRAKKAAEEDANNTIGVWRVKNHLRVRPVGPPSDEKIEENARRALLRDPLLNRFEFNPRSRNGYLYLYGAVDTYLEKFRAEEVLSKVKGVVDVENKVIVIDTRVWKSDREIEADIEQRFLWNAHVADEDISVSVQDGVVVLSGRVESRVEVDTAVKIAFEEGAKSVKTRLEVLWGPDDYQTYAYEYYYSLLLSMPSPYITP